MTGIYNPTVATKALEFGRFGSITPSTLHIVFGDLFEEIGKIDPDNPLNENECFGSCTPSKSIARNNYDNNLYWRLFLKTVFKSKRFVEKIKINDQYAVGLELVKGEENSESVQTMRRNWNKLHYDHVLGEQLISPEKLESVSGQFITGDTNWCAEIALEELVEAVKTFLPPMASKHGAKNNWCQNKQNFS